MKPIFFFAFTLWMGMTFNPTAEASVSQWGRLHRKDQLVLKNELRINASLTFPAGTEFHVKEMLALEEVQIEKFLLTVNHCTPSIENTSVSLTILDQLYGFELFSHCQAQFYVSFKDLFLDSYFEKIIP